MILKMQQSCVKTAWQYKVQLAVVALAFLIVVNIAILCHVAIGSGSGQTSKGIIVREESLSISRQRLGIIVSRGQCPSSVVHCEDVDLDLFTKCQICCSAVRHFCHNVECQFCHCSVSSVCHNVERRLCHIVNHGTQVPPFTGS